MLKVVAAVYLVNFLGIGPELVPFDTMAACQAAKAEISRHLAALETDEQLMRPAGSLICVKAK